MEEDLTKTEVHFKTWGLQLKMPDHPWFSSRNEEQREVADVKNEEAYIQKEISNVLRGLDHARLYKHAAEP